MVIEEITEETVSTSPATRQSSSTEDSSKQPRESTGISKSENGKKVVDLRTNSECLQALKEDPEAFRFVPLSQNYLLGDIHLLSLVKSYSIYHEWIMSNI